MSMYQVQEENGQKVLVPLTDTTPVDEVAVGNIQSVTSNAVAESLSYSTTENLTGGTWIDGKPIYRKVIPFTIGNSSTQYVTHNVTNYETIVGFNGYVYNTAQGARSLDFSYYGSTTWCSGISFKATQVLLEMGSAFVGQYTGASAFIIIEYTKTS